MALNIDWTGLLIGLLMVGLVLSPLTQIVPKPAEKRRMRMRERALGLRLQVQMAHLPKGKYDSRPVASGVPEYLRYSLPQNDESPVPLQRWWRHEQGWQDAKEKPLEVASILESLSQLPADVVCVEISEPWLAIYWRERGSEEDVEKISSLLSQWQQAGLQ